MTTRRTFLGRLAGGLAALAGLAGVKLAGAPASRPIRQLSPVIEALKSTLRLSVYSGSPPKLKDQPTGSLLAAFDLPEPNVSGGAVRFPDVKPALVLASGNPTYFRVTKGSQVLCQGTAGVGHGDLAFNSVLMSGGTVLLTNIELPGLS